MLDCGNKWLFFRISLHRQIESTEYVDDLFELKSRYGVPMLSQFAELVNREMFWVVTEVCSEHNLVRRSKIIKQFIKIARKYSNYFFFLSLIYYNFFYLYLRHSREQASAKSAKTSILCSRSCPVWVMARYRD